MSGRGKNPNSLKNLKKLEKGCEPQNPAGKPPGTKDRSTILRELLKANVKKKGKLVKNKLTDEKTTTYEQAINIALIDQALKGDVTAIKEVQDTLHGKIKEVREIIRPDITAAEVEGMSDEDAAKIYDSRIRN